MIKTVILWLAVLALFPSVSFAQAPSAQPTAERPALTYPGSFWTTNGSLSPAERGNLISLSHAEQGILFKRYAEVFVSSTLGADSKGYDWNNKSVNGVGLRLTQTIKTGMVRVSAQWVVERRWITDTQVTGAVFALDSYFQWGKK